jgi:coproporphyrinogen III oxidase-like Fe-S oxidoreductase
MTYITIAGDSGTRRFTTTNRNQRKSMNTQTLRNWPVAKAKLMAKYAILSDADLQYEEGQEEELINRLRRRTGARRDEIERFFEDEHSFHVSG